MRKTRFKITDACLERLKSEKLPDQILTQLETMRAQKNLRKKAFLNLLKVTIGVGESHQHESIILKHAQLSFGLTQGEIVFRFFAVLATIVFITLLAQTLIEFSATSTTPTSLADEKLAAEIKKIRSDTIGSLFWLKMFALFVTVGGAVGGYLAGQNQRTRQQIEFEIRKNREQLEFEIRKNVDEVYQSMVRELSAEAPLLRATAAVKLGGILKSFPHEWSVTDERRDQLIRLTKQTLAASLAIEEDTKVLKTLTIALVHHHPWQDDPNQVEKQRYSDARGLDFSGAKAIDAYWARVDFTYADFFKAELNHASFREAILEYAQFRQAILSNTVLASVNCTNTNFKLADLRGADFTKANLTGAIFEEAKVYGTKLRSVIRARNPDGEVDISKAGNRSKTMSVAEWLAQNSSES